MHIQLHKNNTKAEIHFKEKFDVETSPMVFEG